MLPTHGIDDWDGPASGVICAFLFSEGRGRAVPRPDLATPEIGSWSWTHLRLGDVRALALVRGLAGLPADALELFTTAEARVQIVEADGWVFGVLPDLERDLSGRPQGAGRLTFAFDGARLVTGRLHALLAVDDLRHAAARQEPLPSPAAAVVAQVEFYVERMEALLEDHALELARVEDYVLAEPKTPQDTGLSPLRRSVARHRRELQGLRSALARAHASRRQGRRVSALSDELAELIAAVDDVDRDAGVLQDRGRLLHEEIDTLINSATNRSMRALTVISTLLIPPTLVTGAFGMNVRGVPFEHDASGFAVAMGVCGLVVAGALVLLKRMGM